MLGLKPFFKYFGAKWRIAPRYPTPTHDTIVEPFAGAAGYSHRYPDKQVVLVDAYEVVVGIWQYLTRVSPEEVLALPDVVETVDELVGVPQEARWLIGFWVNAGVSAPCKKPSKWMKSGESPGAYWGESARRRIAGQVELIRHWRVIHGSYRDAPDVEATWFVDPPYQVRGKDYPHADVDYEHLGRWCEERLGQVMVCENAGATWLPFEPFHDAHATPGSRRKRDRSKEVLWLADGRP